MFFEIWKPYFDTWTGATGRILERILRDRTFLTMSSGLLNTAFRGKIAGDRAAHLLWTSLGLPTYRDQKQILHHLMKLDARLEDLAEQMAAPEQQPSPPEEEAPRSDGLLEAPAAGGLACLGARDGQGE